MKVSDTLNGQQSTLEHSNNHTNETLKLRNSEAPPPFSTLRSALCGLVPTSSILFVPGLRARNMTAWGEAQSVAPGKNPEKHILLSPEWAKQNIANAHILTRNNVRAVHAKSI